MVVMAVSSVIFFFGLHHFSLWPGEQIVSHQLSLEDRLGLL